MEDNLYFGDDNKSKADDFAGKPDSDREGICTDCGNSATKEVIRNGSECYVCGCGNIFS